MWGVYPEAWNFGGVHSDFNFGERIWRSSPRRANLKVHYATIPKQWQLGSWNFDRSPKDRRVCYQRVYSVYFLSCLPPVWCARPALPLPLTLYYSVNTRPAELFMYANGFTQGSTNGKNWESEARMGPGPWGKKYSIEQNWDKTDGFLFWELSTTLLFEAPEESLI